MLNELGIEKIGENYENNKSKYYSTDTYWYIISMFSEFLTNMGIYMYDRQTDIMAHCKIMHILMQYVFKIIPFLSFLYITISSSCFSIKAMYICDK